MHLDGYRRCVVCGVWGPSHAADCEQCVYTRHMDMAAGHLGVRPQAGWTASGLYLTESKCPKCGVWQPASWAAHLTPPGLIWENGCVGCGYDAIVEAECELRPSKANRGLVGRYHRE